MHCKPWPTRAVVVSFYGMLCGVLYAKTARAQSAVEVPDRGSARLVVDGVVGEWSARGELVEGRATVQSGGENWRGPSDASLGYALARDNEALWIAVVVRDDQVIRSRAHTERDDTVVISLGWNVGDRAVGYDVFLQPGEAGRFAAVARWPERAGTVAGAQVVEGPNPEGGFVIEARIPWRVFAGVQDHREGLRMRVAYRDFDRGDRAPTVIATGPGDGAHPEMLPLVVGASSQANGDPARLLQAFRDERGVHGAPRLDQRVDLDGDGRPERVVVFTGLAAVFNTVTRTWTYTELDGRTEGDLLDARLQRLVPGVPVMLVLRERVQGGGVEHGVTAVWRLDARTAPVRVFAQETSRSGAGGEVSTRVVFDGHARARVTAIGSRGVSAETFGEVGLAGIEPVLTPWGENRAKVFVWSETARRFVVESVEVNPNAESARRRRVESAEGVGMGTTIGGTMASRMGPDVDGVLRMFRAREGIAEGERPTHEAQGDVAEDARAERVMVFRHTLVVVGPGYQGGRSYYSMGLPLREGDTVMSLSLADITGDAKSEALVRVRRRVTTRVGGQELASERELVLGYCFDATRRGRIFGVEAGRRVGPNEVTVEVHAPGVRGNREVIVDTARAVGWTQESYPFHDAAPQGFFPLMLPWQTGAGRVVYRWNGTTFTPAF